MKALFIGTGFVLLTLAALGQGGGTSVESQRALVDGYCSACHNDDTKSGGFSFTELDLSRPDKNAEQAERVIRKIRAGMMPPAGAPRP
jgi:mono/diheme cytochrome c family protein